MELFKKHSIDARYHLCLIIVVELIVATRPGDGVEKQNAAFLRTMLPVIFHFAAFGVILNSGWRVLT